MDIREGGVTQKFAMACAMSDRDSGSRKSIAGIPIWDQSLWRGIFPVRRFFRWIRLRRSLRQSVVDHSCHYPIWMDGRVHQDGPRTEHGGEDRVMGEPVILPKKRGRAYSEQELEAIKLIDPRRHERIIARRVTDDNPDLVLLEQVKQDIKNLEPVRDADVPPRVSNWLGKKIQLSRNGLGRKQWKGATNVTVEGFMNHEDGPAGRACFEDILPASGRATPAADRAVECCDFWRMGAWLSTAAIGVLHWCTSERRRRV